MSNDLPDIFDETMTDATEQTGDSTEPTNDDVRDAMSDHEPGDDRRAMTGPQDEAFDPLELYDLNRHRVNGDETAVILSSFGRGFQALAVDVDKAGEILAVEEIGDAETKQEIESMCNYWTKQHPKGVLGGEEGGEEGGETLLSKLGLGGGDS